MNIKTPIQDKHYRPDIDGLRAIAVMAVVFFHLDFFPFTGGYIGVDIFFVISGFLITRILVREIDEGRFSIVRFYERRMRRIAPALFSVILASLIAGFFIFMPDELKELGKSVRYTIIMCANIYWWKSLDYFSAPPDTKPMLHMWSLGVEEQFYLFLPLILLYISLKFPHWRAKIIWGLLLISLAASLIYLPKHTSLVFYWLPFRAWELLAGSILVFLPLSDRLPPRINAVLAALGLLFVITPIFYLQGNSSFPGLNAIPPVLGSALLIWVGTSYQGIVSRIISLKPVVYIGLISYSLYLWHWPIIVYARYWFSNDMTVWHITLLTFCIFAISIFSYHFIERPFRDKKKISAKAILYFTIIGAVFLFALGTFYVKTKGLPDRLSEDLKNYVKEVNSVNDFTTKCINNNLPLNIDPMGTCHLGVKDMAPNILLLGDSFASSISDTFGDFLKANNQSGIIVAAPACPPILGVGGWDASTYYQCEAIQDNVLDMIDKWKIKTVVLYARWPALERQKDFKWIKQPQEGNFDDLAMTAFAQTIQELQKRNIKIIIFESAPIYDQDIPLAMARRKLTGSSIDITMPMQNMINDLRIEKRLFSPFRNNLDILFVDLKKQFCFDNVCYASKGDKAFYWDNAHLNAYGSQRIAPVYEEIKPFLNSTH